MLARLVGALPLVVALTVGFVAPASADPYGPQTGSAFVSRTVVYQGQAVNVRGDGFCPGSAVTVTVTADGERYFRTDVVANSNGVASTRLRLKRLGSNEIRLEGCRQGGGSQLLTATVRVGPWPGRAHRDERVVHKGEKVTVNGDGFCRKAPVFVTVLDEGKIYKRKTVRANGAGEVETKVRLTKTGTSKIALSGCRDEGWTQKLRTSVRVKKGSASLSLTSVTREATGRTPGGAPVLAAGALLLAFVAGQLVGVRRRRARS